MAELIARSPVSGEVLGTFPVPDAAQAAASVARARQAAPAWAALPIEQRLEYLTRLRHAIVARLDQIVAAIGRATGKPPVEALASDVLVSVEMLRYLEKNAAHVLADEPRPGHSLFMGCKFHVEYAPLGVVLVIAPWNYPLQLALVPAVTALAAGNAVVLKPSEVTPTIGELIAELGREAGLPDGVLQVVQGDGQVGQALIAGHPDRIFFTGSTGTGRRILEASARDLIAVELELGGKDPMLVFADARLERAAAAAVWGAFANAGQLCVSVERVYVESTVHERFLDLLVAEARKVRRGTGMDADIGPLIHGPQKAIVEAHLRDAEEQGARLLTQPDWEGPFCSPVIVSGATHSMKIMREETFGPVLPVMPFTSEAQAVALANDSAYGLNASVWTSSPDRARRVASALVVGNVAINDVVRNIGNPHMPFGGERQSGFGRYHGPEGLRAFSRQKSVMSNASPLSREINWFPYSEGTYQGLKMLIETFQGEGSVAEKSGRLTSGALGMVRRWFGRTSDKEAGSREADVRGEPHSEKED